MQSIFDAIAADKTLQALAIIITLGSFAIFFLKLVFPFIVFIKNLFSRGYTKATVNLLRKIIKRVRRDIVDSRRISASIAQMQLKALLALGVPLMLAISLERAFNDLERYGVLSPTETQPPEWWAWAISMPIGFTIGYISIFPTIRLIVYLRILRRKLYRTKVVTEHAR